MNKNEYEEEVQSAREIDIRLDNLKYLYKRSAERMVKKEDAIQNNLTETFFETLKDKIDHRELIVIAVRGEVRTGKSTIVMELVRYLNQYIHDIGLNSEPIENMSKYIFSDQTEFLRFINSDSRNAALAIDEFNGMARTGLNATTEEALFDYYSDVFAGQYLHRITASPDAITDKNTTIILDVIGKDEQRRTVRCELIYRDVVTKRHLTLGHVDINVGGIIKTWADSGVRDIVEKTGVQSLEEQRIVDEFKKTDFYVRYQIKKYKRMELLKKYGVRDIRDLEFSMMILDTLRELEDYAKIKKVNKELVATMVDEVTKRHGRIYSILAANEIASRTRAILDIFHEISLMQDAKKKGKLRTAEIQIIDKTIKQAEALLAGRVKQQERYCDLYKEYMNIT